MSGGARRLLRALRHAPDRILHPVRRRAVLSDLRSGPTPRSLLFLCHGNICRSPYAAAVAERALGTRAARCRIASAGFIGPGRSAPPEAVEVAARRGIDLSGHRSRTVDGASIGEVDLVVVMSRGQARAIVEEGRRTGRVIVLGDLDPDPIDTRAIRDPVEQPADVFEDVYARIDRCVAALATAVGSEPPAGPPEHRTT
ncbi:MAG: low molecular weight phosphatase family protein [Gemmatimonadota bacterium]